MTGYSGTPLAKKLGLTDGLVVHVSKSPAGYFDWIAPLPKNITVKDKLIGDFDFIHVFVQQMDVFKKRIHLVKGTLEEDRNALGFVAQEVVRNSDRFK